MKERKFEWSNTFSATCKRPTVSETEKLGYYELLCSSVHHPFAWSNHFVMVENGWWDKHINANHPHAMNVLLGLTTILRTCLMNYSVKNKSFPFIG